jgi:uncharacterized protein
VLGSRYSLYRDTGSIQVFSTERGDWQIYRGSRIVKTFSLPSDDRHSLCFSGYPDLHIVSITDRCNHICTYCQASSRYIGNRVTAHKVDPQQLDRIVHFVLKSSNDRFTVEFQGGEPLLNFGAIEYLVHQFEEAARYQKKAVRFRLVSNLTTITREVASYLALHPFTVSTSLDGLPELHNAFRRCPEGDDSYSRAVAGINLLCRHGISPTVLVVVTRKSLKYPKEIVDNLARIGIYRVFFKPVYPMGYAKRAWRQQVGIEPNRYGEFWKQAMQRCLDYNVAEYPIIDGMFSILLRKVLLGQDPRFVDLSSPCGAVHGQIAYDLEGHIYTCDEGRFGRGFVVGNVADSTFEDISQHPLTIAFRKTSRTDEEQCGLCAYRPWCGRCPAMAYHEHNESNLPSSTYFYCKIMKALFDAFFELVAECPDRLDVASRIINLSNLFRFYLRS